MPSEINKLREHLREREQVAIQQAERPTQPPDLVKRAEEPLPAPQEEDE